MLSYCGALIARLLDRVPDSKVLNDGEPSLWYGSRGSLANPFCSFHLPSQSQLRHRPSESIRSTIAAKGSSPARALNYGGFEKPSLHQLPTSPLHNLEAFVTRTASRIEQRPNPPRIATSITRLPSRLRSSHE